MENKTEEYPSWVLRILNKKPNPKTDGGGYWAFLDEDWIPDKYYWGLTDKNNHSQEIDRRK